MATGLHAAGGVPQHQVGGYVLRRWLAQGGMAELYLATPADPARGSQLVVLKRVLPQFAQDPQFVRMFAREAQLASALKHPNIVEVFEAQAEGMDECFFAMEYVHGPDLSGILRALKESNTPMPIAHALTVAAGICAGLNHAHDHRDENGQLLGIVHRDVSPSNVMIAHDGAIKLMDFGVAKALALTSFTQAGTRKGKLSYMSPEQAVADPVDRRTDVFAIGAVLFEMTTMQRMLGGDNELAVMHKLLFRERPKPSEIQPGYPPDLERLVLRAVAQDPANRFQTAAEMQQEIEHFAAKNGIRLSPTALSQWVATVVEPKPHPANDPSFYSAPQRGPDAGRETTVAEGAGPQTQADQGARELVTALEQPSAPATAVGHMVANDADSGVGAAGRLHQSGGAVIITPGAQPPTRASGSVPAMPAPRNTTIPVPSMASTTRGAAPKSTASVGLIIGVAALFAVSAVGAAIWYTRPPAEPEATQPAKAAVPASDEAPETAVPVAAPPMAEDPPPVVARDPTPLVEDPPPAVVDPPPAVEDPPLAVEDPPPAVEDPLPAVEDPPPVTPNKRDKSKKKRDKTRKKTKDPQPSVTPTPSGEEKKRPPPPPPPPKKKDKPPTDTLLPGQ